MQLSDRTIADAITQRALADNHVFSLYTVQFSPRDVVYVAAKFYHRGNTANVREVRSASSKSWPDAIVDLLRALDLANLEE